MARFVAVVCPHWPVISLGLDPEIPAAVFHANRVVAASAAARSEGVRRGMRRREAQSMVPNLIVEAHDPGAQMRAFEDVISAVETFTPCVEVTEAGVCMFDSRGPARYFGGEERLVWLIADAVDSLPGRSALHPSERCRVGIADTPHAARLAAWKNTVVPPGETREFLAPWALNALNQPPLESLLSRLGIRTLGELADLPLKKVVSRFGIEGYRAHNIATATTERILAPREIPPDLDVTHVCDPAVETAEQVTFVAKVAADKLISRLDEVGLACTRVVISMETEHSETSSRTWRSSGPLTAHDVAERTRWQLDGWISSGDPTAGVIRIVISPDEITAGSQQGLWGRLSDVDVRVRRALERVQGLLGPSGVELAVVSGGRDPGEQTTWVGWGEPLEPARAGLPGAESVAGPVQVETPPWPGRLPPPYPTRVFPEPEPVSLIDGSGAELRVGRRLAMSGRPAKVAGMGTVEGWAGPWPSDVRWWDTGGRRRVRLQVRLTDGTAHLLSLEGGTWYLEATWD